MTLHHDGLRLLDDPSLCGEWDAGDQRTFLETPTCTTCAVILRQLAKRQIVVITQGGFTRLSREAEEKKDAGPFLRAVEELRRALSRVNA